MENVNIRKENIKLFELVCRAVSILTKKDKDILERNLHERSIVFRLGHYLQYLILNGDFGVDKNKVVVDAEYNKNIDGVKGVYKSCRYNINGCVEYNDCYIKTDKNCYNLKDNNCKTTLYKFIKETNDEKYMIPDLLIHERMSTKNTNNSTYEQEDKMENKTTTNFVAIEVKKKDRNSNEKALDLAKLTYLTCKVGEYKYKLGLYLIFNRCECSYMAFEDGKIVGSGALWKLGKEVDNKKL